jgi:hypothetical protein
MPQSWLKDPDDVLDYMIDWTAWLGTDSIATSTWVVPVGLTKTTDSHTATTATIWLSGGTANSTYTVTNHIVTAGGRIEDRSLKFRVLDR